MFKLTSSLLLLSIPVWAATCPPSQVVDGRQCTVTCSQDRPGGDFAAQYTGSFQGCINACAANAKCLTAQYHESNGYCYLKNSINPATSSSGTDSVVCAAAGSTTSSSTSTSTTLATSKSTSTTTTTNPQPTTDAAGCQEGRVIADASNEHVFIYSCAAKYTGTILQQTTAANLLACTNLCDGNPACVSATLYKPTGQCFLFSDLVQFALSQNDFDSALLLKALDPGPFASAASTPGGSKAFKSNSLITDEAELISPLVSLQ